MKIRLTLLMLITALGLRAQTAMQISGPDCNGVSHDLYADLDDGKAVLVYFFMTDCSASITPGQQIQKMIQNVLKAYPGMVTGYAMPYENITDCKTTSEWVVTNNLPLFAPYDSGAAQVAHYGGFGMPTVVLLGGKDHRVLFSTKDYSPRDTVNIRESILNLFTGKTGVNSVPDQTQMEVYPNPAHDFFTVQFIDMQDEDIRFQLIDLTGKTLMTTHYSKMNAGSSFQVNTSGLEKGIYILNARGNHYAKTIKIELQ